MIRSTNTRFAVAVHVLTYLAGDGVDGPVNSDELAHSTGANPVYVRRVLGPLREAGLVRARPGPNGGWELAAEPRHITLADVWCRLHDGAVLLGLHDPAPGCAVGRRVQESLVAVDHAVAESVVAELGQVTVQDVLDGAIRPAASPTL